MRYNLELMYSGDFDDLTEKEDSIKKAITYYNNRKFQMQNPKTLSLDHIEEKKIYITLDSALPLTSPGKALRIFSMDLMENEGFKPSSSGQLFRTRLLSEEQNDEVPTTIISSEISDTDFLKALIDYVCNKSSGTSTEYKRKNAAFHQMIQIAIEAGIIPNP